MNLLKAGVNPNSQDSEGNSALHASLRAKNKVFFETLLADKRVNLNILNNDGFPPLIWFAFIPEALSLLLKAGANLYQSCGVDQKGTILSSVCQYPLPTAFRKQLLETGIDPNRGIPAPIESAALHGDEELLDMLIKGGANPFIPQKEGYMAIHEILLRSSRKIIDKLLNMPGANLQAVNANGDSLLDIAIKRHDFELTEELLKRGVRLGKHPYFHGFSTETLNRIGKIDNYAFLKLLIDYHQDISPNLGSILISQNIRNPSKLLQYFEAGVITDPSINIQSSTELEPKSFFEEIIFAAIYRWNEYKPLVEFCLNLKANVNIDVSFFFERIPLIEQVLKEKNKEFAELLIKSGLDRETYKKTIDKLSHDPLIAPWLKENGFTAPEA